MGTTGEWLGVLFLAAFWGGGMQWFTARRRAARNDKPAWRISDVLLMVPIALCFGVGVEFEARAFQRPLLFVMVAALLSACLLRWAFRKKSANG